MADKDYLEQLQEDGKTLENLGLHLIEKEENYIKEIGALHRTILNLDKEIERIKALRTY
jgi:peptidoglycan hydrolase CwlO-like protein